MTKQGRSERSQLIVTGILGMLAGGASQMNWLGFATPNNTPTVGLAIARIMAGVILMPVVFWVIRRFILKLERRLLPNERAFRRFADAHSYSYFVFLAMFLGAVGIMMRGPVTFFMFTGFIVWNVFLHFRSQGEEEMRKLTTSHQWLAFLFLLSGLAALIYQVTWQRTLFAFFGVNIESVTIIVTIFMLGLGLGSLLGGYVSRKAPQKLPALFLICEILIGVFGLISLPLIKGVGAVTLGAPLPVTGLVVFALLLLPTLMMGATLPILVSYLYNHYKHIARTVGVLYFLNTLGSAIACFFTTDMLFVLGGQQMAVLVAACLNVAVGILVYRYTLALKKNPALVTTMEGAVVSTGGVE